MTTRREFIKTVPAAAAGAALAGEASFANPLASADLVRNDAGDYILPPLAYDYAALEPHIDEATMRLHHDKHHLAYVNGMNAALKALAQAREANNFDLVSYYSTQLSFHGSGHLMHAIFWKNMAPNSGGEPKGDLAQAIVRDFGSFAAFKTHFTAAATKVEGSGWGVLGFDPYGKKLLVLQVEKHQNLFVSGVVPLLVLDVWEHAYYLKYQNRRVDYVNAFFNVINWDDVAARYAAAVR
jgi:Fe-Mn family superoxide dismutase